MTEPGWYSAQGDPLGTVRYWDGSQWVGDAVPNPASAAPPSPDSSLASPGLRCGARAIDWIILLIPIAIFIASDAGGSDPFFNSDGGGFTLQFNDHRMDTATEFMVVGLVPFLWQAAWLFFTSATPGKFMLKARVVSTTAASDKLNIGQALVRSASSLVLVVVALSLSLNEPMALVMLVIATVSFILLFVEPNKRTVMDFFAQTKVVER